VNFGKYLEPTSNNNNYILSNPIGRIATTTQRRGPTQQQLPARLRPAQSAAQSPDDHGSIDTAAR
jgi:hypothetical protein